MAGITLAQAEAQLTAWLDASTAVATGQAYSIAGRSLTRANAAEIRENIKFWNAEVKSLSRGGLAIKGGTPT
jgi:Flp pilus assembly protein TadG